MRVMTWNLWWRFGPWEKRQPGIAEVVRSLQPDILCLQEVWAAHPPGESMTYQAADLAATLSELDSTKYHCIPAGLRFRDGLAFTNAIVSRWPIVDDYVVRLPKGDGTPSFRTAAFADIETPDGIQPVVTAHIAHKGQDDSDRLAQAQELGRIVKNRRADGDALPAIVAGDINATPDSPELDALCGPNAETPLHDVWELPVAGAGGAADASRDDPGWTWATTNQFAANAKHPNRRLDYILVEQTDDVGPTVQARGLAGTEPIDGVFPSDHFAVWADLI